MPTDQQWPNFTGPVRLDPAFIPPAWYFGLVGPNGTYVNTLPIPSGNYLQGLTLYVQAAYDPNLAPLATLSPMELMTIQ